VTTLYLSKSGHIRHVNSPNLTMLTSCWCHLCDFVYQTQQSAKFFNAV